MTTPWPQGVVLHTADARGTPYVPVPRTLAYALPALHVTNSTLAIL
jgi:hypothetical protein